MHVEAAVELPRLSPQRIQRKLCFADRATGVSKQDFQQIELSAGQLQRFAAPCGCAFCWAKNQARRILAWNLSPCHCVSGAAQNGAQTRGQFPQVAGLAQAIVSAKFEIDNTLNLIVPGAKHDDRQFSLLSDPPQDFASSQPVRNVTYYDNIVVMRCGVVQSCLAIMLDRDAETLALKVSR